MIKVLTLEEVFKSRHRIVCEFRYGIQPQKFQLKDIVRWLREGRGKEYAKTWRCWNDFPGDTLRANTPWK